MVGRIHNVSQLFSRGSGKEHICLRCNGRIRGSTATLAVGRAPSSKFRDQKKREETVEYDCVDLLKVFRFPTNSVDANFVILVVTFL